MKECLKPAIWGGLGRGHPTFGLGVVFRPPPKGQKEKEKKK
jgi:hypothetical protein